MKLDAAYVKRTADATGFDAVQLEKVIRLRQLLVEFRKHHFLRERLVGVQRGSSHPNPTFCCGKTINHLRLVTATRDSDHKRVGCASPPAFFLFENAFAD
jgi:hypothetical protein